MPKLSLPDHKAVTEEDFIYASLLGDVIDTEDLWTPTSQSLP